jgi:DNA-binding MarR family transcriptional regulator/GNAT superfamily N-acetyltransferase
MNQDSADVAAVRRFTRFYTRQIDLLNEGLLRTRFPLTDARVLYELANRPSARAGELGRELGIDAGYLSRILRRFEEDGLLTRSPDPNDGRQAVLAITEAGREAFLPLDRGSREQVEAMLAPLAEGERQDLTAAMSTIERVLRPVPDAEPYRLRPLRIGDIGIVTQRQGVLYGREYGFDITFEALVAEIAAGFVRTFDPGRENAWIAERRGAVAGSAFLVRVSEEVAKLRLVYVEPSARGLGIGSRLVAESIAFARDRGYAELTLWTNDILVSARRIYEAAGFELTEEEPHRSFGRDLIGQYWRLRL